MATPISGHEVWGTVCHDGGPLTAAFAETGTTHQLGLFVKEINSGESHENSM